MEVLDKKRFLERKKEYCQKISEGAVFVYPTDTIYGIGCDATNSESVEKIREMKRRDNKPFSIAAPSKEWIKDNFAINPAAEEWIEKLPGPYTLVLRLKNKKAIADQINPDSSTVGVRILGNWFSEIISELNFPIVSTSANITQEAHMKTLSDLDKSIAEEADFIIYEGTKTSRPSSIVDLTKEPVEIKSR